MFGYPMSLLTRPARESRPTPARVRLGLEALGRRDVPATANLVTATGELTITGDGAAETVVVTELPQQYVSVPLYPGHFAVGGVTSVTWNGARGSSVIPVTLVKSIRANLGGGGDSLTVTRQPVMYTVVNGQVRTVTNPFVGILQSVNVDAGAGDDTVNLSAVVSTPATVYGRSGDDTIRGGSGNDVLYGDSSGLAAAYVTGDDTLYGGRGVDSLFGGNGNDGLFAGVGDGAETLNGGAGADRYLVPAGEDTISYLAGEDARITFRNSPAITGMPLAGQADTFSFDAGSWRNSDIERLDVALGNLHRHTGNTRLLETAAGGGLGFLAVGRQTSGRTNSGGLIGGWNDPDANEIAFVDVSARSDMSLYRTVYHEFGHNWDEPEENEFADDFRAVSGWIQSSSPPAGYTPSSGTDDNWYYRTSAAGTFAREYGKTNPEEDMGTAWEAYFVNRYHGGATALDDERLTRSDAKWATLDDLFDSLR
jgi:Ca2+-binding RTX toxin-like protein